MAHSLESTSSGQEWCSNLGVLPDKSEVDAVNAIKAFTPDVQFAIFHQRSRHALEKKCHKSRVTGRAAGIEGAIVSSSKM